MTWTIEYIEALKYVRVTGEGDFSVQEHAALLDDIVSRDFWKPGTPLLLDNKNVSFTGADMKRLDSPARITRKWTSASAAVKPRW